MEDFSDIGYLRRHPRVKPRVGDQFQAEIPELMSESERAMFLSNSSLIEQPNFEAVPEIPSSSWDDFEVDIFVLGLYTFGKNFTKVKKFMETKGRREILFFYYSKFYNSARHKSWSEYRKKLYSRWSESRKKTDKGRVFGKKIYSGWRLHELLSRLIPSIKDEYQKDKLVQTSKSFAERKITLDKYVNVVKNLVGLKLLVEAMWIGKGKEDLTLLKERPKKTKTWFEVSTKRVSVSKDYTSLTSAEIITKLNGSRLTKTFCSEIFWEAVWPRLLVLGWHSENLEDQSYLNSKDNFVYIVPGVKLFCRGKHVNGDHYFDSIGDLIRKVASKPEILEKSSEKSDVKDNQNVEKTQMMPLEAENRVDDPMLFSIDDTKEGYAGADSDIKIETLEKVKDPSKTLEKVKDPSKTLEKVKDPSKNLIKHKSKRHAETEDHLVESPKRRRLSACIREESISRVTPVLKDLKCDDTNRMLCLESDQLSLCAVQGQCSDLEEMNEDKEREEIVLLGSSEQQQEDQQINTDAHRRQSTRKRQMTTRALEDIESKRLKSTNNNIGTTVELGTSEQQHGQQINTDAPRRQSTRKRQMTTRALEDIESSFHRTKILKSTTEPKKRERRRKPLVQIEDSNHRFLLNQATTESKTHDQIQDSKPVLTENPKLPRKILKIKRNRS